MFTSTRLCGCYAQGTCWLADLLSLIHWEMSPRPLNLHHAPLQQ